jgi:quercetin dioxygenase-like cupin family protein
VHAVKYDDVSKISTEHVFSDGLYGKKIVLQPQEWIAKHVHTYEHFSILASGSVLVLAGDEAVHYTAPAHVIIKANVPHMVYSEKGAVWYCIHATDATDADEVDDVLVARAK